MTELFADTFFYLALFNSQDEAHERALNFARQSDLPTVTTGWVLTELGDASARGGARRKFFGDFVASLAQNPQVTVIRCSEHFFERGLKLYESRLDKEWSFTDCISFVVMRDRGVTDALTGDHHFEQAGFRALFKEP